MKITSGFESGSRRCATKERPLIVFDVAAFSSDEQVVTDRLIAVARYVEADQRQSVGAGEGFAGRDYQVCRDTVGCQPLPKGFSAQRPSAMRFLDARVGPKSGYLSL